MKLRRSKTTVPWRDESGFTLAEVMIVIVLMGIVFGIATASWQGVVQSRTVDSATNQLVADLRKAHSTATNRLAPQVVSLTAGSSKYSVTGSSSPIDLDDEPGANTVTADTTVAFTFQPNGSVSASPNVTTVTVRSGGSSHTIKLELATSRVRIVG